MVKRIILILLGVMAAASTAQELDAKKLRDEAEKHREAGNWKDALEVHEKLLAGVSDARSGDDLRWAVDELGRLNQQKRFDELVEGAIEEHAGNWRVIRSAAQLYLSANHWGFIIDGEFERGHHRGGGQWAQATERDRVRAMQLFLKARELAGEEAPVADRAGLLEGLANAVTMQRTSRQHVWALAVLTPLDELPDYERGSQMASGSGAPVDDDGNPLWMVVPDSWEAAANDGERWRWLIAEMKRLDAPQKAIEQDYRWAQFLVQHYGVGTMAEYSWWRSQGPDEQEGILQVHTLEDDESIAKLAGGVKRFTLAPDYRYIAILREAAVSHEASANLLMQVYLDRRQYVTAVAVLEDAIERHGAGRDNWRRKQLGQIRGDWGRFESIPMMPAGEKPMVPFVFRNASEVSLELHQIKLDLVVDDIFAFLESNPRELDHLRLNIGAIGQRLIEKNERKYLGEKVAEWKEGLEPADGHWDRREMLEMPVTAAGAYLLKAKAGDGNTTWIVVWLTDTALVRHAVKDAWVYYLGDGKAGAPLAGDLEFFGYDVVNREGAKRVLKKFDVLAKRFEERTGDDGLAMVPKEKLPREYSWMVRGKGPDGRRAYLGFQSHYWRDWRPDEYKRQRSFGITDRPVYRPGQKVHMKFWSRAAAYDLDEKSMFAGRSCHVEIQHQGTGKVHEFKNLRTDEWGGLEIEWDLPEDARLGVYYVNLRGEGLPSGGLNFRVEEYKKPEYEVVVEAPKEPVQLGEVIEATVKANYYHGAPVTEAKVKIKVQRYSHSDRWFPAGRWDWLYGRGYWWFGSNYDWYPGWHRWGCIAPVPPWWGGQRWTPPELVLEREEAIGADGSVTVKIDTSVAKLAHGDIDHRYEITAEVVDASRRTIVGSGSVLAARQPFEVTTWLDRGYARPGDPVTLSFAARTLDGRPVAASGSGTLHRVSIGADGEIEEKKVKGWDLQTDDSGEGELRFNAPDSGQYRISVVLTDAKGNEQEGATVFVVRGEDDDGRGMRFNDLELVLDKKEYKPGESAKLLVNTNKRRSTVLLFLRSNGRISEKLELLRGRGKSREFALPLTKADMPNIFVEAVTIADGRVVTAVREIVLPPEKRMLTVEVEPAKERYKPREKTGVTIRLKDERGEPYEGTSVVTVYDKSLEYISGGSNVPEIRQFFWKWKRGFSRRGLQHSQVWGGYPLYKPKAERMVNLGRFGGGVADVETRERQQVDGAFGARRSASKALSLNAAPAAAMEADSIATGMEMGAKGGQAGGPAGPEVVVRSEFADLVKWAGSVETDEKGEAVIDLEMPDNLTTWKIKTWGMGHGTRVGEGSAEIITSKDLIVRLQAPRFFVEGDVVTLSAVVHNYHTEAKEVAVSLELEGGTLEARGGRASTVVIPPNGERRVDWVATAKREGEVTIRMMAVAADDADAMEMTFPVYVHGMARTESWSRGIAPDGKKAVIEFEVPEKRRPDETRLEIRYSPTIAGAMVDALPYLANYPYGCTEQTLNRFVPAVITQKLLQEMGVDLAEVKNKRVNLNPQEIGDARERAAQWKHWKENPVWDKDEVDKMVREGVQRLREMQNDDGGWGWFSAWGERSYPHTTAVVVHGLQIAKDNGAAVPDEMLKRGVAWLKKREAGEAERIRMWKKRKRNTKQHADQMDALVRRVLGEAGEDGEEMLGYLFRDKNQLAVYAKCLVGLELHRVKNEKDRDAVITNIEQFLQTDEENQTAWLELGNGTYWWYWYGSEFEAHAWYLKLLAAVKPQSPQARGLVKYLVNNRKHATYWRSTRDTAYCVEALADYLRGSGEDSPDMEIEVRLDGKVLKTVKVTKENLFSFDGTVVVAGDAIGTGRHKVELRKKGRGPLYANAYLTVFSLEDFLRKAGLEVKVERAFYRLVPVDATQDVAGSKGQALKQKKERFERVALKSGDAVVSGDLIEVELSVESKNDYSYLVFEDWKAAGLEPVEVRSGYNRNGLGAFMELRDERVAMFVRQLPRGRHNLSYRLRAEIPGTFSALPTTAEGMYAPELRGNSDEMKVSVGER